MAVLPPKARRWLDERIRLGGVGKVLRKKTVPVHRYSAVYYLGGITLFFFVVQVVTGILLMLYYRPSAEGAYESVEFVMTTVPFGWLVRSIHSWSANLMIFFAMLHLATVFFGRAYRSPRELQWVTGCLALFLALGFGFSGYLLPWNQLSYSATKVGTQIAGSVPVVGDWMLTFLRGGERVTGGTLSRFYGWHVAILPALTTLLLLMHLLLVQLHGMSVPPGVETEAERRRPMKFFPHYAYRELFGWTLALAVLAVLAALFPWELGEKADPFAPAAQDIKPEWYFMFMFETLKVVPGGAFGGIEYESYVIMFFGLAGLVVVLIPFIDGRLVRRGRRRVLPIAGALGVAYVVVMTSVGYASFVPVLAVVAAIAFILIFGAVIRRSEQEET